jgi:hypothetical protein
VPATRFWQEVPDGRLWTPGTGPRPSVVPSYMRGPNMRVLLGAFGAAMDCSAEQALFGRLQAIASAGAPGAMPARLADGRLIQCEPFVLPILAQQRGIRLYPTEGVLSQRQRVAEYLALHRQRGTHRGEFAHALPYFNDFVYDASGGLTGNSYPAIDVAFQLGDGTTNWHRISAAGKYSILRPTSPNFDWDGRFASNRCRAFFFVRMTGTGFSSPFLWDDGTHTWDGGGQWDVGGAVPFSGARMADVSSMLTDWTSATTWSNLVAFVWDSAAVDPTTSPVQGGDGRWTLPNGAGTWASPAAPGTGLATRPKGVVFWYVNNAP